MGGCQTFWPGSAQKVSHIRPTIAVLDFENKAAVNTNWNLSAGMADELINRLIHTRRYIVLERSQFKAILNNLKQSSNNKLPQNYTASTATIRPDYLIKGVLTDFGHRKTPHSKWNPTNWGPLRHNSQALVAATIYITNLKTGLIIASCNVEATVSEKDFPLAKSAEPMAFGSYAFYHTPLGKATAKMLDKAVAKINAIIEQPPFQPKVASIINGQVVITGGKNHHINVGDEFAVRTASSSVFDPDTGTILGHVAGKNLGKVRVIQVTQKYSIARVLLGGPFQPGDTLFRTHSGAAYGPAAISSY